MVDVKKFAGVDLLSGLNFSDLIHVFPLFRDAAASAESLSFPVMVIIQSPALPGKMDQMSL
jgi:hypothetical protein